MYCLTIYPQMDKYFFQEKGCLLDVLLTNGLMIENPCGGKGTCGKCKGQVIKGNTNEPTEEELHHVTAEEIDQGIRLSCLLVPSGDLTIKLLQGNIKNHRILTDGYLPDFKIEPLITQKVHKLIKSNQANKQSYIESLAQVLDISALIEQPAILRSLPEIYKQDHVTAIYSDNRLIGLEPGNNYSKKYGIAVDIGTTIVVLSLFDLNEGREIDSAAGVNPQKAYGQDVLSRIDFVRRNDNGLEILHKAIIECLNSLIEELCYKHHLAQDHIYEMTVAANTTMMHLLLAVNPVSIGKSPYTPIFSTQQSLPAAALGLRLSPFARLYCLPGVSGYIGADIVAGVNVAQLTETKRNILFIDIGTNGEIVLSRGGNLYSCACAAGPALEGMDISCGMLAGEGAIERVQITDEEIIIKVIGDVMSKGLCGSGIIEVISEIVRVGLMEKSGRLKSKATIEQDDKLKGLATFLGEENKKRKLIIDPDNEIFITQGDIRQVQLAKGAILSGIYTLLNMLGMQMEDLDEVIIAGQFGKHLSIDSLIGIGLIPEKLREKINYIGNSSKTGAMLCLLSRSKRKEVESIAKQINYFELSTQKGYDKLFTSCLKFS